MMVGLYKSFMKKKILIISTGRADFFLLKYLNLFLKKKFNSQIYLIGDSSNLNYNKKCALLNYKKKNYKELIENIRLSLKYSENKIRSFNPNAILVLGDRYELIGPVFAAFFKKIKIFHLHGGEISKGSLDNNIRNFIESFSTYHFVAHNNAKMNLIKKNINKKNIHIVGSVGLDLVSNYKFSSKEYLEKKYKISFNKFTILLSFHPVTFLNDYGKLEFDNLISYLCELNNVDILYTKSNSDTYSNYFNNKIKSLVKRKNFFYFNSLGEDYFSFVNYSDLIIGNSSSNIIEIPQFNKHVINYGTRQKGRYCSKSVIHIEKDIHKYNIFKLLKNKNKYHANPYCSKNTCKKIINIIEKNI
jgi:GDP/UDP-N,N'-diacetylbacillosamine 2-epimerase (hydrolysing)